VPKQHHNAVLALRARELARNLRPYRSRGSKVARCQTCLLPEVHCLCSFRPEPVSSSSFCFLMYNGEAFKPSNTGRLLADLVADNHAFLWDRTQPEPALVELLANPRYSPIIIFPHQYAEPSRCIEHPSQAPGVSEGRKPLFIMLDGTWREAKKMFRGNVLKGLPVLGITPQQASAYRLREAAHEYQLCTAEVGIEILKLAGEESAAQLMQQYFMDFRRQYIAGRPALLARYGAE
jgi:DTW domain-containing protein YfiP